MRAWLAGLLILLAGAALAQEGSLQEAHQALDEGRYVRARELAEAVLKVDPEAAVALYVLGKVYYEAEGSLPRAYYYLSKAERRLKKGELHRQTLALLAATAHDMERYQEALDWIARHERQGYKPSLEPFAGWPLMKLGRSEEARRRMKALLAGDLDSQVTALNTLGAMEWESGGLEKSREHFVQIVMLYRMMGLPPEVTFLWNKAESELSLGDFAQAERDLLEAAETPSRLSYSNPYDYLALIYADQARFPEAVSAVRRMQQWNAALPPAIAHQKWSEVQTRAAAVLLACGYDEAARQMLARVVAQPDRNAATSERPYLAQARTLTLYQASLKLGLERQAEARSWTPGTRWWGLWGQSSRDAPLLGATRTRAGALIAGNGGLSASLQAYGVNWAAPPWLLPDAVEVYGPGVAAAQVRRMLQQPDLERQRPFLLAILAEARLRQGRYQDALDSTEQAQEHLPEGQVLLRARLAAVQAAALEKLDRGPEAVTAWRQVLEVDPGTLRRLGLALPVSFEGTGETARIALGMLRRSPRLRAAERGFVVRVSQLGSRLEARLLGPDGAVLARALTPERPTAPETARALCEAFHEMAFAPRVDLSQTDINSLDASNASTTAVRERMLDSLGLPRGETGDGGR